MIILVYNKGCDIVKKLNNKGFAISTVLYGLLIVLILITTLIIATMSSSRKNSAEFTENITRNLESVPKKTLTDGTICANESTSFIANEYPTTNVDKMCSDLISKVKERYFMICYDNGGTNCNDFLNQIGDTEWGSSSTNGDWVNTLYSECIENSHNESSLWDTVKKGCCFYRTQSRDSSKFYSCY